MRNSKFLGVYSHKNTGNKSRAAKYFVWQLSDDAYAVQELDASLTPRGKITSFDQNHFKTYFKSEPSILAVPVVTPDFRGIPRPSHRDIGDKELADLDKARRSKQLENDLRDAFQKAIRALGRARDKKGALTALEKIADTQDGITHSHRHMFRDFGVALRKQSLPELALQCAKRVVALSPGDDHARFNLARILAILGKYEDADAQLRAAMQLDPSEKVYGRFIKYLAREKEFARDKQKGNNLR